MTWRRGRALAVAVALIAVLSVDVSAAATPNPPGAQDDISDELPSDAGRIIGSPDAGPDPTHSGDRGGWLQFVLLGTLAAGVSFIFWRIYVGMREESTSA